MANAYGEPSDTDGSYWDTVENVLNDGKDILEGPGDLVVFVDNQKVLNEYFPILMDKVQSTLEAAPGGGVIWDKINAVLGNGNLDTALKALEVIGHAADFLSAGKDIADAFMDDDQDGFKDAIFNLSEMIVVKLGEWAGSHFGPSIGAQIGTMINPGIGTAIGWLGGKIWGDNIGGKLGEWLVGFFEDDIKSLADRLYTRLKDGGGGSGGGSGGDSSLDLPVDTNAGADTFVVPHPGPFGPGGGPGGNALNPGQPRTYPDWGPGQGPGGNGLGTGHPMHAPLHGASPEVNNEQEIKDFGVGQVGPR